MQTCIATTARQAPLKPLAEAAASEKLASGVSNSLGEANVWQTEALTVDSWQGNDYMHARYYSSSLGRFLSVDPVGGSVGSSQSWNRYSYVQNNPLIFADPNGEDLHLVFNFEASDLSENMQKAIVEGVRQGFREAGVNTVNFSFYGGSATPSEESLRDFDQMVFLHFITNRLGKESNHGKNLQAGPGVLTNHGVVSSYNVRLFTDEDQIINYLVNVALHEANHAGRLMTEYDGDSIGTSNGGPAGSPTQQGVSRYDLAKTIRRFADNEAARFRALLNPPAGNTDAWVQQMKAEMAAARKRKLDNDFD